MNGGIKGKLLTERILTPGASFPQWYPGHIARAERQLKEQLRLVDVAIDVRTHFFFAKSGAFLL